MKKWFAFSILAFSSTVSGAGNENKGAYFLALTAHSTELSSYLFLVDQLLETKCGKPQSLASVEKGSETQIQVLSALKNGQYDRAKAIVSSIACDK